VPVALVPNAIAFRSPRYGIMGTGWQSCAHPDFHCRPQGTISLTTDGGRTWKVLLRTPRPVVAVSVDGNTEQAVLDDGETIGSSDGGRHWAPVVVPVGGGNIGPCPAGTISHSSGDWWLCTTQGSAGNMGKSVYRVTANGPKRVAYTPFVGRGRGGISSYGYPQGIAMAPDGFGLIWESRGTLYVTRDGGSDWVGLPRTAQPEVDFGTSAVALRGGVGFVVLAHGGGEVRWLIATTDAGRSWRVVHRWS
jgi:hypothetical protein